MTMPSYYPTIDSVEEYTITLLDICLNGYLIANSTRDIFGDVFKKAIRL